MLRTVGTDGKKAAIDKQLVMQIYNTEENWNICMSAIPPPHFSKRNKDTFTLFWYINAFYITTAAYLLSLLSSGCNDYMFFALFYLNLLSYQQINILHYLFVLWTLNCYMTLELLNWFLSGCDDCIYNFLKSVFVVLAWFTIEAM